MYMVRSEAWSRLLQGHRQHCQKLDMLPTRYYCSHDCGRRHVLTGPAGKSCTFKRQCAAANCMQVRGMRHEGPYCSPLRNQAQDNRCQGEQTQRRSHPPARPPQLSAWPRLHTRGGEKKDLLQVGPQAMWCYVCCCSLEVALRMLTTRCVSCYCHMHADVYHETAVLQRWLSGLPLRASG
jgi:hypothetical protein